MKFFIEIADFAEIREIVHGPVRAEVASIRSLLTLSEAAKLGKAG